MGSVIGQRWEVYTYGTVKERTPKKGEIVLVNGTPDYEREEIIRLIADGSNNIQQLYEHRKIKAQEIDPGEGAELASGKMLLVYGEGGGYEIPPGSIQKSQLSPAVQGLLAKADTALQSETDPVYTADKPALALKSEVNTETQNRIDGDNALSLRVDEARVIAEGRSRAKVFATTAEMNAWLAVPANTATLNTGDNLYIIARNEPDYWWDGSQAQLLETGKVDLAGYYTVEQINQLLAGKLDITAFNTQMGLKVDLTAFNTHNNDNTRHITAAERTAWNGKLDAAAQAADSAKLGGQLPSYYAKATDLADRPPVQVSGVDPGAGSPLAENTILLIWGEE